MTSQPQTQLTNIDSALAALRDGRQTVEQIGQYIGGLWQAAIDAKDETAVSYYEAAWGLANVLAESNDNARAIVQEVTGQRDQVAGAYAEYQTAVINMDMEHPEAGRHIKLVHSKGKLDGFDDGFAEGSEAGFAEGHEQGFGEGYADGNESGFEDGQEFALEGHDPESDLSMTIAENFEVDQDDASIMASILFQSYGYQLPITFYNKVGETIKALVAEAIALRPDIQAD